MNSRAPGSRGRRADDDLEAELRDLGISAGLDAVGIASAEPFSDTLRHLRERKAAGLHGGMQFTYRNPERSTDPSRSLRGAKALFVGAMSYRRADPPDRAAFRSLGARPTGVVARYSWRDQYEELRGALAVVSARLGEAGWRTAISCDDNALVDRAAAVRAGIGFYGKNSMVLLPGRGSWFVLGSLLTNAPLRPTARDRSEGRGSEGRGLDGCGPCVRCLSACPTGALTSPGVLDARRCLAWMLEAPGIFPKEHREALGARIYGCDECQAACPINRRADMHHPPPEIRPGDEPVVDLAAMLLADDDELLERFGRWYVPGREARYLRRNALVALGNSGDPSHPAVIDALRSSLRHSDPIVRSHAVWAAGKLRLTDLVEQLSAFEEDPDVLSEVRSVTAAGARV